MNPLYDVVVVVIIVGMVLVNLYNSRKASELTHAGSSNVPNKNWGTLPLAPKTPAPLPGVHSLN